MEKIKYLPTQHEFAELATESHFSKEELSFQKKMALKAGYLSWDDYVKFMYNFICNFYDFYAIANEIAIEFYRTDKLMGSLPILINRNTNTTLENELQPIIDKVDSFSHKDKNRINQFERKWTNLFISLIIDKCKSDPKVIEFVQAFQLDFQNQFTAVDSQVSLENALSLTESIQMPNANAVIKKHIKPNFYFPLKRHLLKKLHNLLLDCKFIEANEDFEKTFELKDRPQKVKPTIWCVDGAKLYYLLYCLNDNKEFAEGQSIDKIANQLFVFKKDKSPNAMRTVFRKALNKFEDSDYLKKKMSIISDIIEKLPN